MQTAFYFGYMAVVCYAFLLMLGTVGFRASLTFVRHVQSSPMPKTLAETQETRLQELGPETNSSTLMLAWSPSRPWGSPGHGHSNPNKRVHHLIAWAVSTSMYDALAWNFGDVFAGIFTAPSSANEWKKNDTRGPADGVGEDIRAVQDPHLMSYSKDPASWAFWLCNLTCLSRAS